MWSSIRNKIKKRNDVLQVKEMGRGMTPIQAFAEEADERRERDYRNTDDVFWGLQDDLMKKRNESIQDDDSLDDILFTKRSNKPEKMHNKLSFRKTISKDSIKVTGTGTLDKKKKLSTTAQQMITKHRAIRLA